jgi:hypothetical protein
MANEPLIMVGFTTPLDEMSDAEIEALAGEIAEAMAANLGCIGTLRIGYRLCSDVVAMVRWPVSGILWAIRLP